MTDDYRRPLANQQAPREPADPAELPYQSDLLASLSALIALWDSPRLQREALTRTGEPIDQPSHQLLRHLGFRGPMRPSALSAELGTGASHVSKLVNRLASQGLVQRVTDPSDARAKLIALTPSGEDESRHIFDLGDDLITLVIADWPPDQVAQFTKLTRQFTVDALLAAQQIRATGIPHDTSGGSVTRSSDE